MKPAHRPKRERKKEIIDRIVLKALCKSGYDNTSIRDIALAAGMSKAGLYHYFESKEELLFQVLDGYADDLLDEMRDLHARIEAPAELIQAMIGFQVRSCCNDKCRLNLIVQDGEKLSGKMHARIKEKQREYLSLWRKAIEALCLDLGVCACHVDLDARLLVGACVSAYRWLSPEGEVTPEQLAERIFSTFLWGVARRDGASDAGELLGREAAGARLAPQLQAGVSMG